MNSLQKYKQYISDNPKHYWFKLKIYGWGWTPVTWQGWMVVLLYMGVLLMLALSLDEESSRKEIVSIFILPFVILTFIFISILYQKGESPKWSWGFSDTENEDKK